MFYVAVFGWEIETIDMDGELTMFRVPGYVGGRPKQPVSRDVVAGMSRLEGDHDDSPSHWSVDFWVADVDATADKADDLGGRVVVAPYDTPVARQALLADPQGAVFSGSKVRVPG